MTIRWRREIIAFLLAGTIGAIVVGGLASATYSAFPSRAEAQSLTAKQEEMIQRRELIDPIINEYLKVHPGTKLGSPEEVVFINSVLHNIGEKWKIDSSNWGEMFGTLMVNSKITGLLPGTVGLSITGGGSNQFINTDVKHAAIVLDNTYKNKFEGTKIDGAAPK